MQAIQDIFGIWPTLVDMATAIGAKPDTVYRWQKKGRIPEDSWQAVIDAAVVRGQPLTAGDLLAVNTPPKLRGRPAHKIRTLRRKRNEARL
jgi:hypothetical protein